METLLLKELRRRQVASAADLQTALGISQPSLSRLIGKNAEQVATIGKARAARYALRRNLRGMGTEFPIFRVTESGQLAELGVANCLEGGRWYAYDPLVGADRLFDGIPYFLSDSQPQGFMGRAFPKQHPELRLPERISDWNDDDVMVAIAHSGKDAIGNLIVGDRSMRAYLSDLAHPVAAIKESECSGSYASLAEAALQGDPAGSSAGGEQPKFAATLTDGFRNRHVLVKFSPSDNSPSSQRWRDLLIAEHLAGLALSKRGLLKVAPSRLIEADSRIFLEVTRFDRVGEHGRIGVISLGAFDDEHYGRRDDWFSAADRLERDRRLNVSDVESLRIMSAFGGLIANTDRHFGNISFIIDHSGALSLAPAYDQLPMLYAPSSGQVIDREFTIELPQSNALAAWKIALPLAEDFWQRVVEHPLVSQSFKNIAKENSVQLKKQSRPITRTIVGPDLGSSLKEAQNIAAANGRDFDIAKPLKKYDGIVLDVVTHHVVQNLGRSVVIHEKLALSRNVENGEAIIVKYDEKGYGLVTPRLRESQGQGR